MSLNLKSINYIIALMNRLWIVIIVVLVACAGQQQNEVLVQNVGFAQGSTLQCAIHES